MTEDQINDRCEAFDEAVDHLVACECSTTSERQEFDKAAKMVRTLGDSWYRKQHAKLAALDTQPDP